MSSSTSIQRMIRYKHFLYLPLCMQVFLEGTFSVFLKKSFTQKNIILIAHLLSFFLLLSYFQEPARSSFSFFLCIGKYNLNGTFSIFLRKDYIQLRCIFFTYAWIIWRDILVSSLINARVVKMSLGSSCIKLGVILLEHLLCSSVQETKLLHISKDHECYFQYLPLYICIHNYRQTINLPKFPTQNLYAKFQNTKTAVDLPPLPKNAQCKCFKCLSIQRRIQFTWHLHNLISFF